MLRAAGVEHEERSSGLGTTGRRRDRGAALDLLAVSGQPVMQRYGAVAVSALLPTVPSSLTVA